MYQTHTVEETFVMCVVILLLQRYALYFSSSAVLRALKYMRGIQKVRATCFLCSTKQI